MRNGAEHDAVGPPALPSSTASGKVVPLAFSAEKPITALAPTEGQSEACPGRVYRGPQWRGQISGADAVAFEQQ